MTTAYGIRTSPGPLAFVSGSVPDGETLEFQDYRPNRRQETLTVHLDVDQGGVLAVDLVNRNTGEVVGRHQEYVVTGSTFETPFTMTYHLGDHDLRVSYLNDSGVAATVRSCRIGETRGS